MKHKLKITPLLILALFSVLVAPWFINAYKLTQCDFKTNWRCEITHSAGVVIPPTAYITMWIGTDK